jgi:hypothetical protein
MGHEPLPFDEFTKLYESVSKLPDVMNWRDFGEAVDAATPASFQGSDRRVNVLLSISVTADGRVAGVRAIVPELPKGIDVRGIMQDESGKYLRDIQPASLDPECMAAAEHAAMVLRFAPAEKDGQPVAFPDLRLGVEFSSSRRRGPPAP